MLPKSEELPPPGDEYYEREARKANHYTFADWVREPVTERAKMIAHELVKGMRESYVAEKMRKSGDKPKTPGGAPWDKIRNRFFR